MADVIYRPFEDKPFKVIDGDDIYYMDRDTCILAGLRDKARKAIMKVLCVKEV